MSITPYKTFSKETTCFNKDCIVYRTDTIALIKTIQGYTCRFCGVESRYKNDDSFDRNVEFKNKDNYSRPFAPTETPNKKVLKIIEEAIQHIETSGYLKLENEYVFSRLIQETKELIIRCYKHSEKFHWLLPKDPLIIATSCILVAMERIPNFEGHISTKIINEAKTQSKTKKFPSKVLHFKQSVERIINDVPYQTIKWENIVHRTLRKVDIPFKVHKDIYQLFENASAGVWLNGKHTSYTFAAVCLHILFKRCPLIPIPESKMRDVPETEVMNHICDELEIKVKPVYGCEQTIRHYHNCTVVSDLKKD